jgi:hypothetical protein
MATKVSLFAGKPDESPMLVNVPELITAYCRWLPLRRGRESRGETIRNGYDRVRDNIQGRRERP